MNIDWIPDAYEAGNAGDWGPFTSRLSDDYSHHVPSLGISWKGPSEAAAGLKDIYASTGLVQSAVDVCEHGPFVIVSVLAKSNLHPDGAHAVHVFRAEGDRLVELWGIYPPLA